MSTKKTLPWLKKNASVEVAVLGDLILDEYIEGQVSRISPEAPVPVNLVSHTFSRAGGAANAALNIQKLNASASLFGVWGKDQSSQELENLLRSDRVNTENIISDPERPTTRKTRIAANKHQIVRVDWEKSHPISEQISGQLLVKLEKASFDALLISDYGKGSLPSSFVQAAIKSAANKKKKVIIDPKGTDYRRYEGAYLITPNRKEACLALGLDPSEFHSKENLAKSLLERFAIENVLITLGAAGMYFLSSQAGSGEETSLFLSAEAREVFDVSGAGDTVAAVVALGVATGVSISESMKLANLAAGIVVGKWGTQPVEAFELIQEIEAQGSKTNPYINSQAKVKNLSSLLPILGSHRERSRRVVFTNGCFDILHAGHVSYLEKARALGDLLVIGVNSDASVRRLKGSTRPINSCEDRMQLLAALSCVDYVLKFDDDTPLSLIEKIAPEVLVKGADWDVNKIIGADSVLGSGGKVETIPFVDGISTSEIIRRVKADEGLR